MDASLPSRRRSRSQSLFYRDLSASPATRSSALRGELGSSGQAAAVALWRENLGGSDHPPPPISTLENEIGRSSDVLGESLSRSLDSRLEEDKSPARTPASRLGSRAPNVFTPGPGYLFGSPSQSSFQHKSPGSPNGWPPFKEGSSFDLWKSSRDNWSPVSGVVQQPVQSGGLLTLPTISEIVRPEYQLSGNTTEGGAGCDEWVTVFGFQAGDTNSVMREFEKCGTILRHVPGPTGSNWIHILFQHKLDAQKALYKHGMQINEALMVGVKPVDLLHRQDLTEKSERTLFNVLPPKISGGGTSTPSAKASARSYYLQPSGGCRVAGSIASPAKSVFSKIVDLIFGL